MQKLFVKSLIGNLNTFKSHMIANLIEKNVKRNFKDIESVFIYIHPVKISCMAIA